tara:strand:+ start:366 stop:527 length:162 start_codon:yes stop_codon:yes gene_type:complete
MANAPKTPLLYLKAKLGVDKNGKDDFMDEWKRLPEQDKKELREQAVIEIAKEK